MDTQQFDTQCTDEFGDTMYVSGTHCPKCLGDMVTVQYPNGPDDYDLISSCASCGYTKD